VVAQIRAGEDDRRGRVGKARKPGVSDDAPSKQGLQTTTPPREREVLASGSPQSSHPTPYTVEGARPAWGAAIRPDHRCAPDWTSTNKAALRNRQPRSSSRPTLRCLTRPSSSSWVPGPRLGRPRPTIGKIAAPLRRSPFYHPLRPGPQQPRPPCQLRRHRLRGRAHRRSGERIGLLAGDEHPASRPDTGEAIAGRPVEGHRRLPGGRRSACIDATRHLRAPHPGGSVMGVIGRLARRGTPVTSRPAVPPRPGGRRRRRQSQVSPVLQPLEKAV